MKKFFKEFKEFAMKGNIIDMAVGLVIGSAFTAIVKSLVEDIITPLISMLTGDVLLTDLKWVLVEAVGEKAEVAITYGNFIQAVIDFLLIALTIFIVLRVAMTTSKKLEALKKKEAEEEAAVEEEAKETELDVLCQIRDMMKKD